MAKDPAFLFYYQAFMWGTRRFTAEQRGIYIELLCEQADSINDRISEQQIIIITKQYNKDSLSLVLDKFDKDEDGYFNFILQEHLEKRRNYCESRRQARLKADEDKVRIYLLKDNDSGYIKIGSSVNPLRRYNEITNQTKSVNGSNKNRNYELYWYSSTTIRVKEKEIQQKFKKKNIIGEWFDLDNNDIEIIKRMFKHTSQRTSQRTVNENEIENIKNIEYLKTKEVIEKLKEKYPKLNTDVIKIKLEELIDYCKSSGKKYKDYLAFARNAIRRDYEKLLNQSKCKITVPADMYKSLSKRDYLKCGCERCLELAK